MDSFTTIKEKVERTLRHISLAELPYGAKARVVSIEGSGVGGLRLMEMGVVPGASISVVRAAPLGDPLQVCLRDYHLALRRIDADRITVFIAG